MSYKYEHLENEQIQREFDEEQQREKSNAEATKRWKWVVYALVVGATIRFIFYITNILGA